MTDGPHLRRGVVACAVLGMLLLQAAWILTIPPFRGSDEFEHAFKAAAVARGDYSRTHVASDQGRGQFMTVPRDLVEAAIPTCDELKYTTPDQCHGHASQVPGMVEAASNAATYNPTYYVLPGLVSRLFSGVGALYAMRIVSAIMCTALLGLSFLALRRWTRTPWLGVAMLAVFTPTFLYTTSITAPNGLEVAAAVLVWSALLGLLRRSDDEPADRVLVGLAGLGAVLLTITRALGPVWLLLIVVSVVLIDPGRALRLARDRSVLLAAAVTCLVTLGACWWILTAQVVSGKAPEVFFRDSPWPRIPGEWVLWFFQSIAAIPLRDIPSPAAVYAVGVAGWAILFGLGVRLASGRLRLAIAFIMLAVTVVAIGTTLHVYGHLGTAWQGRYGYPLTLGVLLLCGLAIERRASDRWRYSRAPALAAGAAMLVMTFLSQWHELRHELATSPLAHSSEWVHPSVAVLLVLDVAGAGLLAWAVSDAPRGRS